MKTRYFSREFPFAPGPRFVSLFERACTGLFYLILLLHPFTLAWFDFETREGTFLPKLIFLFGVLSLPLWRIYYRHWTMPTVCLTIFFLYAGLVDFVRLGAYVGEFVVPIRQSLVGVYYFVVSYNLIRRDGKNIKYLVFALLFEAAISSLFAAMGMASRTGEETMSGERISVLGQNSNGTSQAAGRLILFALLLLGGLIKVQRVWQVIVYAFAPICAVAMLRVASRGGMSALILSLPFFMLVARSVNKKMLYFFLTALAGAALIAAVLTSGVLYDRLVNTIVERDTGGREGLFWAAILAWKQSILFGRGLTLYRFDIGEITDGLPLMTHNSYIFPFVSAGLIGAAFYFPPLISVFRQAWQVRRIPYGNFAFLMMIGLTLMGVTGNIECSREAFVILGIVTGINWQYKNNKGVMSYAYSAQVL